MKTAADSWEPDKNRLFHWLMEQPVLAKGGRNVIIKLARNGPKVY